MWNPFLWRPLYCFIRTARFRFQSKRRPAAGKYLLTVQSLRLGTPTIKKCSGDTSSRSKPAQVTDKVDRQYSACLGTWAKGTPVSFFLVPNKRLSNVQYKAGPVWGIRGVERGGSGKAPAAAREFKRAISWKSGFSVEVV